MALGHDVDEISLIQPAKTKGVLLRQVIGGDLHCELEVAVSINCLELCEELGLRSAQLGFSG